MARCPFAHWMPAGTPGGAIKPRVVILHTEATAGKAAPHSGLEWHFWIGNDGRIEQLVDTERRADANYRANAFAISVETEDDGTPDADPWTAEQVDAIVRLCQWAHDVHGIPLRRCEAWDGSGIGHHTMWGAPSNWTPVKKSCPGAARKAQFDGVILPTLVGGPPPPTPTAPSGGDYDMDTLDLTNAAASPVRGRHVDNLQALMVPLLAFVGRGDLVDPLLNPYGVPDGIAGAGTAEALAVTQDVLRFFGLYSGKTDRVCGPGTWRGLIEF